MGLVKVISVFPRIVQTEHVDMEGSLKANLDELTQAVRPTGLKKSWKNHP